MTLSLLQFPLIKFAQDTKPSWMVSKNKQFVDNHLNCLIKKLYGNVKTSIEE